MKDKNQSAIDIYSLKQVPINAMLLIVVMQLIAHASYLPYWLSIFTVFVCIYRYFGFRFYQKPVNKTVIFSLFVAAVIVFVAHYRTNFTVEMAGAFLFLMAVLKLLEIYTEKDIVISIYTLCFLTSVSFLFEQGFLHTLLQLVSLSFCLSVLLALNSGVDFRFVKSVRSYINKVLFKGLLFSIPIVVVCFIFFPRLSPLWTMPFNSDGAKTGMGSRMSPGDISKLTQSADVAFRAEFSGALPPSEQRYWRAMVLDVFDGREWSRSPRQKSFWRYKIDPGSVLDDRLPYYEVIMEPHFDKWVFSLDGSTAGSTNVVSRDMGVFQLKTPAIQPTKYRMNYSYSSPESVSGSGLSLDTQYFNTVQSSVSRIDTDSFQDLQLPPRMSNPRVRIFVEQILADNPSDEVFLIRLLENFRRQSFYYSLEPPKLGQHVVDEFMFDSMQGFCEHYSSSLAFMLRLAKIPARVVVGYQGGELSPDNDYLIVRQYDAHAWVEAKLAGKGWVRIDPTAMVAPDRILSGGQRAFQNESGFLKDSPMAAMAMKLGALNWLNLYVDDLKYAWQSLVVNYNQDQQHNLVESVLGEFSIARLSLVFVYFFLILLFLVGIYLWYVNHNKGFNWSERKYLLWLMLLSKLGWARDKGETPRQFASRIEGLAPSYLVKVTRKLTYELEEKSYKV